jgi:hypothetical protein
MAILFPILLVFFFVTGIYAQGQPRPFSEAAAAKAAPDKHYDSEKWTFALGSYDYEIDRNGSAQRRREQSAPVRFRLDLGGSSEVVRVYHAEYKGDLLLLCEDQLGGEGSGFISRFDGASLRQKWRVAIPAFNIANGLIEGNSAYLGAIGYAAKLNLDTGKIIWKHDDFYRKYREEGAFNIFDVPKIVGNEVIYVESQDRVGRKPNVIKFNKTNGKVIKVELN